MAEGANLFAHLATADEEDSPAASTNMFAHLPAMEEGSFIPEAAKGIAGGAVAAAGTALKGQAASQEVAKADRREYWLAAGRYFSRIDAGKEPGKIVDPDLPDLIKLYQDSTEEQRAQLREAADAASKIHPVEDLSKSPLFQAGEATQEWSAEQFKAAEDYQNSLTRTFTEALGSMVTMAGTSLVSRGAGILTGIDMSVGEQVDMALQQGASKEDVLQAANLAFFPGATEYAPLEVMFSKIPVGKWGKFADALIKVGASYLVEGGQEAAQQKLQNDIAKFTYNPDQDPWENVASSFLVGGAVGGTVATAALPFTLGGEQAAPPAPEGQPRPRYEPPPAGAQPADTILPPEPGAAPAAPIDVQIIPADQAPPAPVLRPSRGSQMVVNDPEMTLQSGEVLPAGALDGQTVTILESNENMSFVRDADGKRHVVGNKLLAQPPQEERVASPRLTETDRTSPIPNDVIDDGKALVEVATGQPSSITTTEVVDGKRQVVQTPVAELTAQNRAKTQAVINQILQGVTPSPIATAGPLAAPPAVAAEVPGTAAPAEAPAAVEAPVDTALERATAEPAPAPIEDVSDDAHPRSEDTQSFAEFVAKSKAHLAEREAQAEAIAEKGGSTRMEHQSRDGQRALIGPDMAEPGKFRITRFDKQGPFGHTTFNTLKEAANEALRDGYVPVERPTAAEPPKQAELKAKVEANRGAAAPAVAPKPETRPIKDDVAITASGRDVPVTYAVIEADDLIASQRDEGGVNPAYPQELQPRDRSRGTSDQQINKIAQNLNPALLDQNPNASDGAPIISEEGVVESGNGRVLAIRRAFTQGLATAKAYVDYLASKGYPVQGMRRPVLVRVRKGQLATDQRQAFTREANERTTLAMSATERAMADAKALKPETVELYRGGEISDAGNRDFVRSFMQQVVNPNEQAAMVTPEGGLSQEAIRRIQSALLASAYGDADLVGSLVESTDTNIKAIGGALMDVAGLWAQMRSEAKSEAIDPDVDVTPAVLEAVRLVQRARNEGRPLSEFVAQKDIFSGTTISPAAEAVLRLMFRNTTSWTMPAGREKLADALRFYATEARKTTAGVDLLGETAPPATAILATAKARQYGETAVQEKLPGGDRATGKDTRAPSQERAVKAEPRPQAEGRPSPAPEVRAEDRYIVRPSKGKAKPWMVFDTENGTAIRYAKTKAAASEYAAQRNATRAEAAAPKAPAKAELPEPKFKLRGIAERFRERERAKEAAALKAALLKEVTSPEIDAAVARMNAIPKTDDQEGYGTVEWFAKRVYQFGADKVRGFENAIPLLVERARNLAVKELNESRKKDGLPLLKEYKPDRGRRATIVIGPPAAGKSTIANAIALRWRSAIVDVDDAKTVIPEYQNGIGANAVHEESSLMGTAVLRRLISNGDNLVIPKVGHKLDSIEKLRSDLAAQGYTVDLVLMDVDPRTAVGRMIKRFKRTGRLIAPAYFLDVVDQPPNTYTQARQAGKFDGYSRVVSRDGYPTRVSEAAGAEASLAFGERLKRDGAIRPGRRGEGPSAAQRSAEGQGEPRLKVAEAAPAKTQVETKQVQGGEVTFALSPQFAAKADAVLKDLRAKLDKLGLTGVDLKVWQQIFADMEHGAFGVDGLYLKNLISVALTSAHDPDTVLHHEAIHALFDLKLFSTIEAAILNRKSQKDWITDEIKRSYPEAQWVEEGIAHAYTDWLAGARMDGVITKAFKKIKTFMKGLLQTLTGHDFRTADDIFRQVTSGQIGRRSATAPSRQSTPLFTFGGSRAETLDRAGLMRAQDMRDAGASRDEIYDETGFFVGHEGRWRFEINDDDAVLDMSGARGNDLDSVNKPKLDTLGHMLNHPKLFAAYPSLASIPTVVIIREKGYWVNTILRTKPSR